MTRSSYQLVFYVLIALVYGVGLGVLIAAMFGFVPSVPLMWALGVFSGFAWLGSFLVWLGKL